uniref:WAT1-related protein n=1 Tax=Salix viminalis TaxID=40686 RepID=A0A6N2LVN3_SALVM
MPNVSITSINVVGPTSHSINLNAVCFLLFSNIRLKITFPVFLRIMALGLLGPIRLQLLRDALHIASFASAIMNAVPLVIAFIFRRLERVRIKEIHSQAKVVGTLVTLGGALPMTVYKGPEIGLIKQATTEARPPRSMNIGWPGQWCSLLVVFHGPLSMYCR